MRGTFWGLVLGSAGGLVGCATRPTSVGLSLLFQNHGPDDIGVLRFAFDGEPGTGPIPGALGVSKTGGKQLSFMPGDRSGGMPKFVDVEWVQITEERRQWWDQNITNRSDKYSKKWFEDYQVAWKGSDFRSQRVDLTPIITPELVHEVASDTMSAVLKLTIVFKDGHVTISAEANHWERRFEQRRIEREQERLKRQTP